ncbi:hypothetical protein DL768_007737 [Monosporascus sp. mg162]|nr:hypothetical protein DL768_007737 [Monosporascus sp. mg162]
MIREGQLGRVLSVTKGLKILRWEWFYREDLQDEFVTDVIDLDKIVADLSHVRDTLIDLSISAISERHRAEPELPPLKMKGSWEPITGFDKLRRLEVPLPFLVGYTPGITKRLEDGMPRNIEFLTITDDLYEQEEYEWPTVDLDLLEAIRSWLGNWRSSTPHLRGIRLLLRKMDAEWGPPMRYQLRELCAQAGIQVEITKFARDLGWKGFTIPDSN